MYYLQILNIGIMKKERKRKRETERDKKIFLQCMKKRLIGVIHYEESANGR